MPGVWKWLAYLLIFLIAINMLLNFRKFISELQYYFSFTRDWYWIPILFLLGVLVTKLVTGFLTLLYDVMRGGHEKERKSGDVSKERTSGD